MKNGIGAVLMLCWGPVCWTESSTDKMLCRGNETVVFTCSIKDSEKIASICGSTLDGVEGEDERYMQYRFGEREKVEFEFPAEKHNSMKYFYYTRGGLFRSDALTFVNGSYLYTVGNRVDTAYPRPIRGVVVESREKKIHKELECSVPEAEASIESRLIGGVHEEYEMVGRSHYQYYSPADHRSERNDQLCTKPVVDVVMKSLGIEDFYNAIISEACVTLPDADKKIIATFAYDINDDGYKGFIVALVDTTNKRLVVNYKGKIQEDASMLVEGDSLRIDSGFYRLARDVTGFGIDVKPGYQANCGDGGSGPYRTLFTYDGKSIKPVLEDFIVSSWSFLKGGNPRCGGSTDDVVIEDISLSIDVGTGRTNGLADLQVTAASSVASKQPFKYVLRYDGKKYATASGSSYGGPEYDKWESSKK